MIHFSKMLCSFSMLSDVYSCLFGAITSSQVEEMISSHVDWTEAATAICHSILKSVKTIFTVCILW